MLDSTSRKILEELYSLTKIQILAFSLGSEEVLGFPNNSLKNWFKDEPAQYLDELQKGRAKATIWYTYPFLYNIILPLTKQLAVVCIGPMSITPLSREQVHAIAAGHSLNGMYLEEFVKRISEAIPMDYYSINNLARLTHRLMTMEELPTEFIRVRFDDADRKNIEPIVTELIFQQRESAGKRISLQYENEVLDRVRSGSLAALAGLTGNDGGTIGSMSQNPLNQAKYTVVTLATLLARAAIDSGVDDEMAFSLSDALCQRMDAMKDPLSVNAVAEEALVLFTRKIGEVNQKRCFSPPVQKICDYISAHLHEDLAQDTLAKVAQLSPRAMSTRFREEIGMKINDYINLQRVNEAKYLLKYSNHELCDIAQYLHFSTQSYFTLQFRKHSGMTPQAYRDAAK